MLETEYRQRKSEIQARIREEQARWKNVPGERTDAHVQILALEDQLEKLELQYSQDLEKKKVR